jgi:hypothetical protein
MKLKRHIYNQLLSSVCLATLIFNLAHVTNSAPTETSSPADDQVDLTGPDATEQVEAPSDSYYYDDPTNVSGGGGSAATATNETSSETDFVEYMDEQDDPNSPIDMLGKDDDEEEEEEPAYYENNKNEVDLDDPNSNAVNKEFVLSTKASATAPAADELQPTMTVSILSRVRNEKLMLAMVVGGLLGLILLLAFILFSVYLYRQRKGCLSGRQSSDNTNSGLKNKNTSAFQYTTVDQVDA